MSTTIKEFQTADQMIANVNKTLPSIIEKSHFFRRDSQVSITLQSLTMLNGQSPMRILRQIAAETEQRRMALLEATLTLEKMKKKIEKATGTKRNILEHQFIEIQNNMLNAMKDVAVLTERYNQVEETHGIKDWTEEDFENDEARFHARRGFELLYQNLIQSGRPEKSIIEYLQQFGIHPQVATREVLGYITLIEQGLEATPPVCPGANSLEDFLDDMADKYCNHSKEPMKRMFGTSDMVVTNAIVPSIEGANELLKLTNSVD